MSAYQVALKLNGRWTDLTNSSKSGQYVRMSGSNVHRSLKRKSRKYSIFQVTWHISINPWRITFRILACSCWSYWRIEIVNFGAFMSLSLTLEISHRIARRCRQCCDSGLYWQWCSILPPGQVQHCHFSSTMFCNCFISGNRDVLQ